MPLEKSMCRNLWIERMPFELNLDREPYRQRWIEQTLDPAGFVPESQWPADGWSHKDATTPLCQWYGVKCVGGNMTDNSGMMDTLRVGGILQMLEFRRG